MSIPRSHEFLHIFRFSVELNGRDIACSEVKWDGPCLVITRPMESNRPALYAELFDAGVNLGVVLWTREYDVAKAWRVTYERIVDRGFQWLDAVSDEIAREAVALVGAHMEPDPARVAAAR